jgi:hypothetical protein
MDRKEKDWLKRIVDRASASVLGVLDEIIDDPQGRELIRRSVLDSLNLLEFRVRAQMNLEIPKEDV